MSESKQQAGGGGDWKEDDRMDVCRKLMHAFAERTNIHAPTEHPPSVQRYLWTDAHAVCNYISLSDLNSAKKLVDLVHRVLGHHRTYDERGVSSRGQVGAKLPGASEEFPTRGGLRIGKSMPNRAAGELYDARLEWDRDGQYFHYITRWMHALDQVARATSMKHYNVWARDLADVAARTFVYTQRGQTRMYWKMSVDLTRPVVPSQGASDPLDGLITYWQLQQGALYLNCLGEGPSLQQHIETFRKMVFDNEGDYATTDPLGLGGLLIDAYKLYQLIVEFHPNTPDKEHTLSHMHHVLGWVLQSARSGVKEYARSSSMELSSSAHRRLAFRELGLAIGLHAVDRMKADMEVQQRQVGGKIMASGIVSLVNSLCTYLPLGGQIESFWLRADHRSSSVYQDHADINDVMLATSLAPDGYIRINQPDTSKLLAGDERMVEEMEDTEMEREEKKRLPTAGAATSSTSVWQAATPLSKKMRPPPSTDPRYGDTKPSAVPGVTRGQLLQIRDSAVPIHTPGDVPLTSTQLYDSIAADAPLPEWLQEICEAMGNAKAVLIGEATHGTEEFYRIRALISKILIERYGFNFVAVEGDYPDIARLNAYVQGAQHDISAEAAMSDLQRFPMWMWRNEAVRDFIEWMRTFNQRKMEQYKQQIQGNANPPPPPPLAGFYGLDLYSLFTSQDAVLNYLADVDPAAEQHARNLYSVLDQYREDASEYAMAVNFGLVESQQTNVVNVLKELLRKTQEYVSRYSTNTPEDAVAAKLNAKVVVDAEDYYRAMLGKAHATWNIRDSHMTDIFIHLLQHYNNRQLEVNGMIAPGTAATLMLKHNIKDTVKMVLAGEARGCVWAHNSHLGDASATERESIREHNVGQLVRQRLGLSNCFNVGFTTYTGTVSASGTGWGGRRQTIDVTPGLHGSYEHLLHEVSVVKDVISGQHAMPNYQILLRSNNPELKPVKEVVSMLREPSRLERAIGVQYVKASERRSHYFHCHLSQQFDVLLHIDTTHALIPIVKSARVEQKVEQRAEDKGAHPASREQDFKEEEIAS